MFDWFCNPIPVSHEADYYLLNGTKRNLGVQYNLPILDWWLTLFFSQNGYTQAIFSRCIEVLTRIAWLAPSVHRDKYWSDHLANICLIYDEKNGSYEHWAEPEVNEKTKQFTTAIWLFTYKHAEPCLPHSRIKMKQPRLATT